MCRAVVARDLPGVAVWVDEAGYSAARSAFWRMTRQILKRVDP